MEAPSFDGEIGSFIQESRHIVSLLNNAIEQMSAIDIDFPALNPRPAQIKPLAERIR
jgi:hypothetical protein